MPKRLLAMLMSVAVLAAFTPISEAQAPFSAEVTKTKDMLSAKGGVVQRQEVQVPRSLAGVRGQDREVPRGQESQAPRGQDSQAPRGQDSQAPRG